MIKWLLCFLKHWRDDENLPIDENGVLQEGLFCLDFYYVLVPYSHLRSSKMKDSKNDSVVRPMTTPK